MEVVELSSSDDNDDVLPMKRSAAPTVDDDDDDDVIIIEAAQCTAPRVSRRPPQRIEPVVDDEDDVECCIVASMSSSYSEVVQAAVDVDGDELVVTGETGPVACRDFPHARHLCVRFPFKATPHMDCCELCHCFVCDTLAPCDQWSAHCNASDKETRWLTLRKLKKTPGMVVLPPVLSKSPVQRPRTPQVTHARRLTPPPPRPTTVAPPPAPPPPPPPPSPSPVYFSVPVNGGATMSDYALGIAKRVPKVRYYTTSGSTSTGARTPNGVGAIRPPSPAMTGGNVPSRQPSGNSGRQFRTARYVMDQLGGPDGVRPSITSPTAVAAAPTQATTAAATAAATVKVVTNGEVENSGPRPARNRRLVGLVKKARPASAAQGSRTQARKRSGKTVIPGGQDASATSVSYVPASQPVACPIAHHFSRQCEDPQASSSDSGGCGGGGGGTGGKNDEYLLALEALFELNQYHP